MTTLNDGFYWVQFNEGDEWEPAKLEGGRWMMLGDGYETYPTEKIHAIGDPVVSSQVAQMTFTALAEASSHLDYCGYGDRWERECANHAKLPEKIEAALEAGRLAGLKEG